jgi:hypothetical protein
MNDDHRIPPAALLTGLAGVLPMAVCTYALFTQSRLPIFEEPARALIGYCAIILSFLGGVRWGHALRMTDRGLQGRAIVVSIIPATVAWLLILQPTLMGFVLLPVLFVLLALLDERLPELGAPLWYRRLRRLLTAIVVIVLMLAIYALTA